MNRSILKAKNQYKLKKKSVSTLWTNSISIIDSKIFMYHRGLNNFWPQKCNLNTMKKYVISNRRNKYGSHSFCNSFYNSINNKFSLNTTQSMIYSHIRQSCVLLCMVWYDRLNVLSSCLPHTISIKEKITIIKNIAHFESRNIVQNTK